MVEISRLSRQLMIKMLLIVMLLIVMLLIHTLLLIGTLFSKLLSPSIWRNFTDNILRLILVDYFQKVPTLFGIEFLVFSCEFEELLLRPLSLGFNILTIDPCVILRFQFIF